MESMIALKDRKGLSKNLASWARSMTLAQAGVILLSFLFSRGSFFEVLKPFALALYAASPLAGFSRVLSAFSLVMGNALFSGMLETLRQLAALLIFEILLHYSESARQKKFSPFQRSLLMSLSALVTGLARGLFQGFHLYDVISAVLMAAFVFSLAVLLGPAAEELLAGRTAKVKKDTRILVSKALLLCVVMISFESLAFLEMEISEVIAGIAVLLYARRKGSASGACAGAFIGFVLALFRLPDSLELPGLFALAGGMAGLPFKSKTVAVSLFMATTFLFTGISILQGSMIGEYFSILASGLLFLILPAQWASPLSDYLAGSQTLRGKGEDSPVRRDSHEAADKLYILGKALSRVSRSVKEYLEEETEEERTIAESVIETVAERVCNRCSMCERCWGTHLLKTYKLVEKAVSDLKTDESGQLEIPGWFKSTCTRNEKFFENLGMAYSLYKVERVWQHQLAQTRGMIARQAGVIAGSVMSMARAVFDNSQREDELEMAFLRDVSGMGIPLADIRMHARNQQAMDIVCESSSRFNPELLDRVVKERMGAQMVRVGESRRDLLGYSVLRYIRQPRFKTVTGVARLGREESSASGDSFTFFINTNGCYISAISDGTGSGKKAERYSKTAIQMLENLMEEGMELQLAIKLLRIYLNIRGEHEPLATLDVSAINLANGELRFFKQGAPVSYIRTKAGVSSLPKREDHQGEMLEADGAAVELLEDGDFVIMVSDGVFQAFGENGETELQRLLSSLETLNPQQLADQILSHAQAGADGQHDDMTVLVTRLW